MPPVAQSPQEARLVDRLSAILEAAPLLMAALRTARDLRLPDWLIFSGAIYQPVLNHLTGRAADYGIKDYDLAYFDASDLSWEAEDRVIRRARAAFAEPLKNMVELRNQARVHLWFEAKVRRALSAAFLHRRGAGALHLARLRGRRASRSRRSAAYRGAVRARRPVRAAPAPQSAAEIGALCAQLCERGAALARAERGGRAAGRRLTRIRKDDR